MIFLVEACTDPIRADLDSVAAGPITAGVETRDGPDRAALEAMEQQFCSLGFMVQQYRTPKIAG